MATYSQVQPAISLKSAPSLRYNFRWTFAGNIIYALCQWGILSILAKLGSPVIVGQFALGLAVSAPVFMLTNLQLRSVQATDARSEHSFTDYFTLRLSATALGWLCIALSVVVITEDVTTRAVIVLVSATKAIESLGDVIAGLLQKQERLDRVAKSLMLRGVSSVALFTLVFSQTHSLVLAVGSMVISWASVLALFDFRWASAYVGNWAFLDLTNLRRLRPLLILSLPLGLVMTLLSLNVNIPRYVLQHSQGSSSLGVFASLAYLVIAVNLIVNALGQSVSTRLSLMFAAGDLRTFKTLLVRLCLLGIFVLVVGIPFAILFGKTLISFLYRPEYGDHFGVFAVMVATSGISTIASFVGYGITAARQFNVQVPIALASTAMTTVLSFCLIPRFGLAGAALALFASSIVAVGGSVLALSSALRKRMAIGSV